jgi:hypothetical protein
VERLRPALIWINYRVPDLNDVDLMTPRNRPHIRHCPLCGIAMQAGKSRESLADFDIFRCLTCDTTIREAKPGNRRLGSGNAEQE